MALVGLGWAQVSRAEEPAVDAWGATFRGPAVVQLVPMGTVDVAIVAAGRMVDEARAASVALDASLAAALPSLQRRSTDWLGAVADLGDDAIVARIARGDFHLASYNRHFIGIGNPSADDVGDLEIYRGIGREEIDGGDLYHRLGRDDLQARYHKTQILRYLLMFAAAPVTLAAGITVVVSSFGLKTTYGCVSTAADGLCGSYGITQPDYAPWWASGGLLLAMAPGLFIAGAAINPHPVDVPAVRRLIDDYNHPDPDLRLRPRPPEGSLYLLPSAGPGGGGLVLGGTF